MQESQITVHERDISKARDFGLGKDFMTSNQKVVDKNVTDYRKMLYILYYIFKKNSK